MMFEFALQIDAAMSSKNGLKQVFHRMINENEISESAGCDGKHAKLFAAVLGWECDRLLHGHVAICWFV